MAVAVGFFALLFLILTTNAIEQSVTSTVQAEARVAMLDALDDLFPTPPYWPDPLAMHVVDTYRDPGVVVEVLDAQGQVRYLSTSGTGIPLSTETTHMVLAGQPPVSYTTSVDGQHVRVEALPIRAPVHGVSGNATGVPMGNGPVIGVLLVAKSLSDVDATLLLVRVLLLLARADAGVETPPEAEAVAPTGEGSTRKTPLVELDHAVLQLVRQLRRQLSLEGSTVQLELGPIAPVRVRGDEERLRRVALILLDNALKYTPRSGEEGMGRVIVSLERVDGEAVLRVRDTGIGIEPADVPHLFERFYRADRARSPPGAGLGPSIAPTLVRRVWGGLTTESSTGQVS